MDTLVCNPKIGLAAGLLFSVFFSGIGYAADAPASSTFTEAQFESERLCINNDVRSAMVWIWIVRRPRN